MPIKIIRVWIVFFFSFHSVQKRTIANVRIRANRFRIAQLDTRYKIFRGNFSFVIEICMEKVVDFFSSSVPVNRPSIGFNVNKCSFKMHCIENGPDNEEIIDILCRVCDGTRERTKKKKRNEKDK